MRCFKHCRVGFVSYCLQGQHTVVVIVNVSALKIHMSQDAHDALKEFPGFKIEPRGEIAVKVNLFLDNACIRRLFFSAQLDCHQYTYLELSSLN